MRENRTAKRRDRIHFEILQTAAQLIAERGAMGITFETIAQEADIARKTLYNHFENKETLIRALVMPICNHAMGYLSDVETIQSLLLDDIWQYCIKLWADEQTNIRLLNQITVDDCNIVNDAKAGYQRLFMTLLSKVDDLKFLEKNDLLTLSDLIYETFIPNLKVLESFDNQDILFRGIMNGAVNAFLLTRAKKE